jgi:predicted small lipoprotein YifL
MKAAMKLRLALFAGTAVLLAACGQKGALYLPDEQRNVAVAPASSPAATPAGNSAPDAAPAAPAGAVPQASPVPATPADPADPQTRRSNTAPRTN